MIDDPRAFLDGVFYHRHESKNGMTEREAIASLIAHLEECQAKGQQVIPMDGMLNVLADHQRAFSARSTITFAQYMELHSAYTLAQYQADVDASHRLLESVISTAKDAVNSLLLINGGGCIALLALMGQIAPKITGTSLATTFGLPLLGFAAGLASAALLACLANLGQAAQNAKKAASGNRIRWIAIFVAVISLGAFVFGCWSAFCALSQMQFATSSLALISSRL